MTRNVCPATVARVAWPRSEVIPEGDGVPFTHTPPCGHTAPDGHRPEPGLAGALSLSLRKQRRVAMIGGDRSMIADAVLPSPAGIAILRLYDHQPVTATISIAVMGGLALIAVQCARDVAAASSARVTAMTRPVDPPAPVPERSAQTSHGPSFDWHDLQHDEQPATG